mgnify:CR=1 FL=1
MRLTYSWRSCHILEFHLDNREDMRWVLRVDSPSAGGKYTNIDVEAKAQYMVYEKGQMDVDQRAVAALPIHCLRTMR